jgi:hypothetical protein
MGLLHFFLFHLAQRFGASAQDSTRDKAPLRWQVALPVRECMPRIHSCLKCADISMNAILVLSDFPGEWLSSLLVNLDGDEPGPARHLVRRPNAIVLPPGRTLKLVHCKHSEQQQIHCASAHSIAILCVSYCPFVRPLHTCIASTNVPGRWGLACHSNIRLLKTHPTFPRGDKSFSWPRP